MSKTTYLIFAILFSAFSIIYPAIILIHHPHGYVICTYLYTALTASCGALCWAGHAFKSNPQRTNTKQNAEIKRLSKENEHLNKLLKEKRWEEFSFSKKIVAENAELQKQVNELKAKNEHLDSENTRLICEMDKMLDEGWDIMDEEADEWYKKGCKDTAKKILDELDLFFKGTTFRKGYEFKKIDQKLKEMAKNYNVEMEQC